MMVENWSLLYWQGPGSELLEACDLGASPSHSSSSYSTVCKAMPGKAHVQSGKSGSASVSGFCGPGGESEVPSVM